MSEAGSHPGSHPAALPARPGWVRLRTVVTLRWLAIAGQVAGVLGASEIYDLALPLGSVWAIVCVAVAANLALMVALPESHQLSEGEVSAVIAFDTAQLGALLALTGGLHNPFALLILAPVTIAATLLSLARTLALGAAALAMANRAGAVAPAAAQRRGRGADDGADVRHGLLGGDRHRRGVPGLLRAPRHPGDAGHLRGAAGHADGAGARAEAHRPGRRGRRRRARARNAPGHHQARRGRAGLRARGRAGARGRRP